MRDQQVGIGSAAVGPLGADANRTPVQRRVLTVLAATSLLLAVAVVGAPRGAVADEQVEPRGIDRICPPPASEADDDVQDAATDDPDVGATDPEQDTTSATGTVPTDTDGDGDASDEPAFPDLDATHGPAITCAAGYEVVTGFQDGRFRPAHEVTRAQMATMVAGFVEAALGLSLDVPEQGRFPDSSGSVHRDAIEAIAAVGIIDGREDGTFGPGESLTRGQFTRAVVNAISFADVLAIGGPLPPSGDPAVFDDVPGTTFEADIAALSAIGVAAGTGDGFFAPNRSVTRGQLATFLMRAGDYLDEQQRWKPTARRTVELRAELVAVPEELDDPGSEGPSDDTDDAPDEEPQEPLPSGRAVLVIDAFGGGLSYTLDLTEVPGPYLERGRATLHRGHPTDPGPEVLELAGGDALARTKVSGSVFEADSIERFAAIIADPGAYYVQVATDARPDGVVRGVLAVPSAD